MIKIILHCLKIKIKRSSMIAAAVYFAQGVLNSGARSKSEVCQNSGFMQVWEIT